MAAITPPASIPGQKKSRGTEGEGTDHLRTGGAMGRDRKHRRRDTNHTHRPRDPDQTPHRKSRGPRRTAAPLPTRGHGGAGGKRQRRWKSRNAPPARGSRSRKSGTRRRPSSHSRGRGSGVRRTCSRAESKTLRDKLAAAEERSQALEGELLKIRKEMDAELAASGSTNKKALAEKEAAFAASLSELSGSGSGGGRIISK